MTKIKQARLDKGLSQMRAAGLMGVSYLTYVLWENGVTKKPTQKNQDKLKEVLGIEWGEVVDEAE